MAIRGTINPGGVGQLSVATTLFGLFIFCGFSLSLVGVGLGIAGVLQRDRKNLFAILGLILNATIALGVAAIVLLGWLASRSP